MKNITRLGAEISWRVHSQHNSGVGEFLKTHGGEDRPVMEDGPPCPTYGGGTKKEKVEKCRHCGEEGVLMAATYVYPPKGRWPEAGSTLGDYGIGYYISGCECDEGAPVVPDIQCTTSTPMIDPSGI